MSENREWIDKSIAEMKIQYERCCKKEERALSSYVHYMIRMLNGISQMRYTQFLYYERSMLMKAMEIFSQYFIEAVEQVICFKETEVKAKRCILDEIEQAVIEVSRIYTNTVDSTANSDRQMFMSLAVDTNMYDLSPKYCVFYARILDRLVSMLEVEDEGRYAFLLNPTLEINTKAKILFQQRGNRGRVVVIGIPERSMEDVDTLPVYLLHEAYHVLTQSERMRKERAITFQQNALLGVYQHLFKEIVFHDNRIADQKIKNNLLTHYFSELLGEKQYYEACVDDAELFYGNAIRHRISDKIKGALLNILDIRDTALEEVAMQLEPDADYKTYTERYKTIKEEIVKFRANAASMLAHGVVEGITDIFLYIYREIYADMGCVLTLGLSPKQYMKAFEDSIQFKGVIKDIDCDFRREIVMVVISECSDSELRNQWREYLKEYGLKMKEERESKDTELSGQETDECVKIVITTQMFNLCVAYLKLCAERLLNRLEKIPELVDFQRIVKETMKNKTDILPYILRGNMENLFITKEKWRL